MSLASSTPPESELSSGDVLNRSASVSTGSMPAGLARSKVTRQAHRQYQQTQIETASPTRLVVLLYDGAIRFCSLALEAMKARHLEEQHTNLIKAQRIVGELMGSLNRDVGGEVASNLFRVYTHMLGQLVQANLHDQPEYVVEVLAMLRDLRETWAEVDRVTAQTNGAVSSEPRITNTLGEQSA